MTSFRTQFTSPMYVFCKLCRIHVKRVKYAEHAARYHR